MAQEELATLLSQYAFFITYAPFPSEPAHAAILPAGAGSEVYTTPPFRDGDPIEEARRARTIADGRRSCVFLPGTAFDAHGTRHGRGGGWYDRFLAEVPEEWLRVGFCFTDQFSNTTLVREAWDQPVDVVCVVDRTAGATAVHETRARSGGSATLHI